MSEVVVEPQKYFDLAVGVANNSRKRKKGEAVLKCLLRTIRIVTQKTRCADLYTGKVCSFVHTNYVLICYEHSLCVDLKMC